MKLNVISESGDIKVSAYELSYFSRTRRGAAASKMDFQPIDNPPSEIRYNNIELFATVSGQLDFSVFGIADGVYFENGLWTLEKYRTVGRVTERTGPFSDVRYLCECVLCAYMLMEEKGIGEVNLRLVITNETGEKTKGFECLIGERFAIQMWQAVISRALPFIALEAERELCGKPLLEKMAFPYSEIREGQRDFINDAYYAARRGGRLMVCAPTGIGKTVSALYPALRAIGKGHMDKVFYLTAKTVTGNAAADAVKKMSAQVGSLRCVFVCAKERVCPMEGRKESPCSLSCPLMHEIDRISYEERRDAAMLELLKGRNVIDTATIEKVAEEHKVCPYELSLDVSEYAEVVICDYNYVFDANVRFRRYFEADSGERYMLLIDEAHNLPDRAREMYSAEIDSNSFIQLHKTESEAVKSCRPLMGAVNEVIIQLRDIVKKCAEDEHLVGEKRYGYWLSRDLPEKLTLAMIQFCHIARELSKTEPDAAEILESAYSMAKSYVNAANYANAKFVFFAESVNGSLKASIRCLDPSEILDNMMKCAKATVLFSATFTPLEYFADILGCQNAARLELESPYDPAKLCVVGVDSISTKYSQREGYVDEIAEMIFSVIEAREGNYMVYFPSYEYMKQVYAAFRENAFGCRCVVQKQGMSIAERNKFLAQFSSHRDETLVGFCVLGGAFAEGVDLRGDRLIGTIIVGMGLPKLSAHQNILQNYFEETRENGYDYAYTYPAMIKIQQAAGRVIRSEEDSGVVVLIDERYAEPPTLRLLPKHWRKIKFASDPDRLATIVERFWDEQDGAML